MERTAHSRPGRAAIVLTLALGIGAMTTVFLVIAFVACWLPARRASRIDPLRSLRIE